MACDNSRPHHLPKSEPEKTTKPTISRKVRERHRGAGGYRIGDLFTIPLPPNVYEEKSHTVGNVRIILFSMNMMMMDWGEEVFAEVSAGYQQKIEIRKRRILPDDMGPRLPTEETTHDRE